MFRFLHQRSGPPPLGQVAPPGQLARTNSDADDVSLIARVAGGDKRAFESLYRSYHPRLTRFLTLMASRHTLVEEALNDTMMVVWRRADTYNRQSKVSTWIFAIAFRTACKALQRQDAPTVDAELDSLPTDAPGPERLRSQAETRAALERALAGLSADQRSVLVLTYFHDLPYAEIAQIMGCPLDTVKTRMFHARRKLRALLAGDLRDWL